MRILRLLPLAAVLAACESLPDADSPPASPGPTVFHPGRLKPVDSVLNVAVGQAAPDFTLPAIDGSKVTLSRYRGRRNVVLSFVPAAFTPVCSAQWPGYDLASDLFRRHDAVLLGITADNLPSLQAWTHQMGGLSFPVLSDFWPHGAVAGRYGLLRRDGTTERALLLIDKEGIIRWIDVHDINQRPPLEELAAALEALP